MSLARCRTSEPEVELWQWVDRTVDCLRTLKSSNQARLIRKYTIAPVIFLDPIMFTNFLFYPLTACLLIWRMWVQFRQSFFISNLSPIIILLGIHMGVIDLLGLCPTRNYFSFWCSINLPCDQPIYPYLYWFIGPFISLSIRRRPGTRYRSF